MARVYADVNAQMPRAYWDYDSVNISWGVLENYEVVRKIGRCIIEPRRGHSQADFRPVRTRKILRSIRGNQHRQLPEMRYQSPQASQEEENKARNQDPPESVRWAKYRCALRCRKR